MQILSLNYMGDTLKIVIQTKQDLYTNSYKITINWGNYTSFGKCFLYKSQSYKKTNKLPQIYSFACPQAKKEKFTCPQVTSYNGHSKMVFASQRNSTI